MIMNDTSNLSFEGEQWTLWIKNHFPLIIHSSLEVKVCSKEIKEGHSSLLPCRKDNISQLPVLARSEQSMLLPNFKLWTPFLDVKRYSDSPIFVLDEDRWIEVSKANQTILVSNDLNFSHLGVEANRWLRVGQWIGLARLHDIFRGHGQAISMCGDALIATFSC